MNNHLWNNGSIFLVLPLNLEGLIPDDESVRLLNQEYLQSFPVAEENRTQDLQKNCRFLEHQTVYDWHTASFQGRNNYSKTDPDATFMHMKDDHMRNAQLKPGYNLDSTNKKILSGFLCL